MGSDILDNGAVVFLEEEFACVWVITLLDRFDPGAERLEVVAASITFPLRTRFSYAHVKWQDFTDAFLSVKTNVSF